MAIGSIILNPGAAVFPSDVSPPQLTRVKSTGAYPSPHYLQLNFDAVNPEGVCWQFVMPVNYASGPILQVLYKMTSATTGGVSIDARLSAVTPGDATDVDAKALAAANVITDTVPATAGYMKQFTLTMTNADSVVAGDFVVLYFARDPAAGGDTATGDMEVLSLALSYTV